MKKGIGRGRPGFESKARHIKPMERRRSWNIFGFLKGLKMMDRTMLKNMDWMTVGVVVFLLVYGKTARHHVYDLAVVGQCHCPRRVLHPSDVFHRYHAVTPDGHRALAGLRLNMAARDTDIGPAD